MTNASQNKTVASHSGSEDTGSLTERARDAASGAGDKMTAAASSTMEKVKSHPYAAAGIVAGVAAAVGGAAFAASKLGGSHGQSSHGSHAG
jgi:ElaB/YqjD/DUF883 family membrane-anchored ribosome-binding protein